MPINWHPRFGQILFCDFNTGFVEPEMVKPKRPVVVVSRSLRGRPQNLCTVVPLSTVKPDPVMYFHHQMNPHSLPERLRNQEAWAKCDMICQVSFKRLNQIQVGKDPNTGKRLYSSKTATKLDMTAIRAGILYALSMESLADHLEWD